MTRLKVDRIENGETAVCECSDGAFLNIDFSLLPENTREGSVLVMKKDGSFELDFAAEKARRKANYRRLMRLVRRRRQN